jgi:hypothetical protein
MCWAKKRWIRRKVEMTRRRKDKDKESLGLKMFRPIPEAVRRSPASIPLMLDGSMRR